MSDSRCTLLFLPVSGPYGSGEYMRCRIIAGAATRRWPDDRVVFMLSRDAPYSTQNPFETILINGSPTFNTPSVNSILSEIRPDIVLFDNSGRNAQLRCARSISAQTVYISSRYPKRRKLFRFDRARLLTQHWIAQPEVLIGGLSFLERITVRLTRQKPPLFLNTVYHESRAERRSEFKKDLGLDGRPYVLFCHGGGDLRGRLRAAPFVFANAAERISSSTGLRSVVIFGSLLEESPTGQNDVIKLARVPHENFIDLIHDATLVVSGGGAGMNGQILAHRKLNIAVPFARDQVTRLSRCRKLGLLETATLDEVALAEKADRIIRDPVLSSEIRARLEKCDIRNSLQDAIEALGELRRGR